MDPTLKAALLSWDLRIEVLLPLLLAGVLYLRGWLRLHVARGGGQMATGARLAAYLTGLLVLGLALTSPIDVLGGQFFFMHMIQHLLLVMVVPPLLWLASPLPFGLWGLPAPARRQVGEWLKPKASFRRRLRSLTPPGITWMLFVAALLGWHDPGMYQAALRNDTIHDLEHLSFFLPAMLFWWRVIGAAPHVHKRLSRGARIAYVLGAAPPNMFAGMTIAFSGQLIYSYYAGVPRLWGMSALDDQRLGGILMWIPGSMMYILAALVFIARWMQEEERKPPLPDAEWATEQALALPGLKESAG